MSRRISRRLSVAVALLLTALAARGARAQNVEARVHTLENGMKFLFVPKPGDPNVAAGWVAKVGSVNERPGITGTAHLFEHMMFKGTHTIGTQDIDRDLELIAKLDAVKERLALEQEKLELSARLGEIDDPTDPSHRSPAYAKLADEFRALLAEQKEIIVKDEFDRIYSAAGASGMNAGTTNDFTIYFINVPKNKLELWFWMESDRLLRPVFREFYSERDVVREERRLRTESTPTGKYTEQFEALFWGSSPYSWPVIGWPSDVEAITREEALTFYDTFYQPANLTACLVGDFEPDEAIALANRYFGRIAAGKRPPPTVRTREVEQLAEKRMSATVPARPQVSIRYHTVAHGHKDEAALDVLAAVLNGRTGRLYRELVLGREIANATSARNNPRKYEGYFELTGIAKPESSPEEVEEALYAIIADIAESGVTERELQKVKNQEAADQFRKLRSNFNLLLELLVRDAYLDWSSINTDPERLQQVTSDDVRGVASRYFAPEKRNVLTFYTKEEPAADESGDGAPPAADDPVAALSPEQRAQYDQIKAQLPLAPRDKLEQSIAQIDQVASSASPDQQVFLAAIAQLFRARLAELDAASEDAGEEE